MSPLSDTTNLASGVSKVPLYDHIHSMQYTTLPAAVVALILFTIAGLYYSGGSMDLAQQKLILDTLSKHFNINILLILPAILVILISVFKLPSLLGMGLAVVVSAAFALSPEAAAVSAFVSAAAAVVSGAAVVAVAAGWLHPTNDAPKSPAHTIDKILFFIHVSPFLIMFLDSHEPSSRFLLLKFLPDTSDPNTRKMQSSDTGILPAPYHCLK